MHNFDEIYRKDIRIGDWVEIEKAGEIIPEVLRTLTNRCSDTKKAIRPPKFCPSCRQKLHHSQEEVAVRCLNSHCPAQIKGRLRHFVGRSAMDINSLDEKIIDLLVDEGMANTPADLYELDKNEATRQHLIKLIGVQDKKDKKDKTKEGKTIVNIQRNLEASKKNPSWRLLHGLGIPHRRRSS